MKIGNIISIALNNLKKENRSSSLGYLWLLINPIVEALTYSLVFGVFFPGSEDGFPKLPWIVVGVFTWSFLASSFLGGMDSFYANAHLVKKIKFPLESIPQIKITQEFFRYLLLIILIIILLALYSSFPTIKWFFLIYAFIASAFFLNAATKVVSVIATLVKDVQNFISAIFQVLFWISGVVMNINNDTIKLDHHYIYVIMKLNPFEYLVSTWRNTFINRIVIDQSFILYSITFWTISIILYLIGKLLMNKFKGDFADII